MRQHAPRDQPYRGEFHPTLGFLVNESSRPGELVSQSGIYRVYHHEHRLMHEATLSAGMRFPVCKKCGISVRFSLVRALNGEVLPFRSNHILEDYPGNTEERAKTKRITNGHA